MRGLIQFRGETRAVIFTVKQEPEFGVEWIDDYRFVGLSDAEHDALVIREPEDISIRDRLWQIYDTDHAFVVQDDPADYA